MLSRLQRQNGLYVSVLWKIWYTGQYSIPITAYKIFSTQTDTTQNPKFKIYEHAHTNFEL